MILGQPCPFGYGEMFFCKRDDLKKVGAGQTNSMQINRKNINSDPYQTVRK